MGANVAINGAILFVVGDDSQAKAVGYYRNVRQARAEMKPGSKDYFLRREWALEQWAEHAERMVSQGKTVTVKWWGSSKKAFAWGKAKNPTKAAYKAKQSIGRRDRWEGEQFNRDVDALGDLVLYIHQFAFSV